jgi:hypothetical protein
MLSELKRWNTLSLAAGLGVLAISTGLSLARAEDAQEAVAAATGARASAATAEPAATEPATAETSTSTGAVTPLKQVEVRPAGTPAASSTERPYFVEFRARSAYNYGHTFVVHGRVGDPITKKSVVGLHPAGDSMPWTIGHFIPVPSETGWSDGDIGYNDKYIIAKYRVFLTEAEYRTVLAKMRQMQANTPLWHAAVYNCNAFTGDIAKYMGLGTPFHWLMPKDYVNGIKEMAGGRQQLPSSWLATTNPAAAHQQARQETASPAHQQAASNAHQQPASAPPANARRQHAAVARTPARSQTAEPSAYSYATAR